MFGSPKLWQSERPMTDPRAAAITARLMGTRKYRDLYEPTLERISQWATERYPSDRGAEKAAKRKLHQAYGAYITPRLTGRVEALMESLPPGGSPDELKPACRRILECHASTRERLDYVEELYRDIEQVIGRPSSVLDLASGLNPFTLPWMALAPGASYRCVDIDCRLMGLVNRMLCCLPGDNSAVCGDVLISIPSGDSEVVLLLKALTCLERQQPGVSAGFLSELKADHVVVSFPTRSLGGRTPGMAAHYDEIMCHLIAKLGWHATTLRYPSETVHLLETPRRQMGL